MRDTITSGPFRMRILVQTHDSRTTRTRVTAFRDQNDHVLRFDGGPSGADLRAQVGAYSGALAEFAGRLWEPGKASPPSPDRLLLLQETAQAVFGRVFRHANEAREASVRDDLDFYLAHRNLTSILFDSDLPGIPFDALHHGRRSTTYDPDGFIGMRAPVIHSPISDKDHRRQEPDVPSVGLLGSANVTSVSMRGPASIHAVFEEFGGVCAATEHTPLVGLNDEPMQVADLAALFRALSVPRAVWHLTSHMEHFAGTRFFRLDNGLRVQPTDFSLREPSARPLVGEPLVFLNICASGQPDLVVDENFPDRLLQMQAGGVIATHCLVNESFATAFARRFYRHAFGVDEGQPAPRSVAQSLRDARRDSFLQDSSVASLCYSFHALEDFDLPPVGRSASTVDPERPEHDAA